LLLQAPGSLLGLPDRLLHPGLALPVLGPRGGAPAGAEVLARQAGRVPRIPQAGAGTWELGPPPARRIELAAVSRASPRAPRSAGTATSSRRG
jgi:hypothetical protein